MNPRHQWKCLLWLLVLSPSSLAATRTLACFDSFYGFANDRTSVRELGLSVDEAADLEALFRAWLASPGFRQLESKRRELRYLPIEDYYQRGFKGEAAFASKLNAKVLHEIDGVLTKRSQRKRFRELCTQNLLRWGHVDTVLRLHSIDCDLEAYKKFTKAIADRERLANPAVARYEASLHHLLDKHLSKREHVEAAGEPFLKFSPLPQGDSPLRRWYSDTPIALLSQPRVAGELELSPKQVSACRELKSNLTKFQNIQRGQAIWSEKGQKAFELEMGSWRKNLDEAVAGILSAEQLKRLRQILFQYHVTHLHTSWALKAAGNRS